MAKITKVTARTILDSRGNPTVEVDMITQNGCYTAAVPSGASTGKHEAWELRDGGKRFLGKGVQKAIRNIEKIIAPKVIGMDCREQEKIDRLMIKLDGTKNKSKLGANAILAVSLACARAGAAESRKWLFEYISSLANTKSKMPRPFFNVINGGKHAGNNLVFQEFMISPRMKSFAENRRVGSEIYHLLKKDLHQKYGKGSTNVGDEGGFAPEQLKNAPEALHILMKAINDAGYKGKVDIAIDCAASEFYKDGKYTVDVKKLTAPELTTYYLHLIKRYPIISLEDPFEQEDFESFSELRKKTKIQIVGDDLTVTNNNRIKTAIEKKSCTCLLLKVNQIGTLTEALEAVRLAYAHNWKVMVSHRSGETEDTFIADLAVGLGCGMIKSGAPCRGERTAKYNRLVRIEQNFELKTKILNTLQYLT
ncbi:phosphopyruvate hydratase [Candidatus Woesearchaeota archaeon]|nr:phosphopyruvate hydratase [Candidatus Woesearchaeota archaeon]